MVPILQAYYRTAGSVGSSVTSHKRNIPLLTLYLFSIIAGGLERWLVNVSHKSKGGASLDFFSGHPFSKSVKLFSLLCLRLKKWLWEQEKVKVLKIIYKKYKRTCTTPRYIKIITQWLKPKFTTYAKTDTTRAWQACFTSR